MWLRRLAWVLTCRSEVGAEFVESGVGVGEEVPDDHQHGVADRDDGFGLFDQLAGA
jgi:hypothetical protein